MSELLHRDFIAEHAVVTNKLDLDLKPAHKVDRSFELPRSLYAATVALYLGFFAVTGFGFASPGLIIPMAIFVLFVVAGFGLPTIWTRLAPDPKQRALTMGQLRHRGIMTHTGKMSAKDASIQMLILPVLIFCWGLVVITIAATV